MKKILPAIMCLFCIILSALDLSRGMFVLGIIMYLLAVYWFYVLEGELKKSSEINNN